MGEKVAAWLQSPRPYLEQFDCAKPAEASLADSYKALPERSDYCNFGELSWKRTEGSLNEVGDK